MVDGIPSQLDSANFVTNSHGSKMNGVVIYSEVLSGNPNGNSNLICKRDSIQETN